FFTLGTEPFMVGVPRTGQTTSAAFSLHDTQRRFPACALQKLAPHIKQRRTFTRGSSSRRAYRTPRPRVGLGGMSSAFAAVIVGFRLRNGFLRQRQRKIHERIGPTADELAISGECRLERELHAFELGMH